MISVVRFEAPLSSRSMRPLMKIAGEAGRRDRRTTPGLDQSRADLIEHSFNVSRHEIEGFAYPENQALAAFVDFEAVSDLDDDFSTGSANRRWAVH